MEFPYAPLLFIGDNSKLNAVMIAGEDAFAVEMAVVCMLEDVRIHIVAARLELNYAHARVADIKCVLKTG